MPAGFQGSFAMEENLLEVRRQIGQTRDALSDKVARLESKTGEIKRALNPAYQARIRPWKSLSVSVLVGWALGSYIRRNTNGRGAEGSEATSELPSEQSRRELRRALAGVAKQILWGALTVAVREKLNGLRSSRQPKRSPGKRNDNSSGDSMAGRSVEKNRGREAKRPTEIPRHGWRDILFRVKDEMTRDNLSIVGAGVAFYGFLAIFPAIAALVSIYGLFTSPESLQSHLQTLESILPPEAADVINNELQRVLQAQESSLGWGALGGIVLALWSAAKGMNAMFEAMNITYDEDERRGFIKLNATALLMTLGAILFIIVFLGLVVGVPIVLNTIGLGETLGPLLKYLRWPLLAVAGMFALAVLYRFGPSRSKPQWQWVSPGAIVATLFWLVGSALFSFYVSHFASYNATYGSIGVIVILMMWFFLSVYSILLGAEINAEMERQTVKDTTTGEPKPMGGRGAYAADTIGASH
jgi:membrane protein